MPAKGGGRHAAPGRTPLLAFAAREAGYISIPAGVAAGGFAFMAGSGGAYPLLRLWLLRVSLLQRWAVYISVAAVTAT
ncbi:putative uncharacterized protein [Pseudomonas sp. Os17]|nr:putative uncharacterized protein [Pseudomonas sp. Os17]